MLKGSTASISSTVYDYKPHTLIIWRMAWARTHSPDAIKTDKELKVDPGFYVQFSFANEVVAYHTSVIVFNI